MLLFVVWCVLCVDVVFVHFGHTQVFVCCLLLASVEHVVCTQFLQRLQETEPLYFLADVMG